MSLELVCAELAAVMARPSSGIADAHNAPPEKLVAWPTSWINPASGTVARFSDQAEWDHRIELIVYVTPRIDASPVEFALVAPLISSVEKTLWEVYRDGGGFSGSVRKALVVAYKVEPRNFASDPQITVVFTVDVEEVTQ